jgi:hypothetical protein
MNFSGSLTFLFNLCNLQESVEEALYIKQQEKLFYEKKKAEKVG